MGALVVAACAAPPGDEPVGGPTATPATVSAASAAGSVPVRPQSFGSAHGTDEFVQQEPSGPDDAEHAERRELREETGPAPIGLQRRLGRWDLPGPFLKFGGVVPGRDYAVSDRCESPELLAAWEAAGRWGALAPEFGMTAWTRRLVERELARCTARRFEIADGGIDGSPRYFSEREAADRWIQQRHADVADRYSAAESETLRGLSFATGFIDSEAPGSGRLGIVFAPEDAPVDEVRVLGWSVHARDGALRGLVRNWSRHLWAYEVAITAEDRTFLWPLSVQPGEIAPFEIGGWQGPTDPALIDLRATADMSPHVDPSRAYAYTSAYAGYGSYPQYRIEVSGEGWERYSDVWDETEAGAVTVGLFEWDVDLTVPDSHPSLADDIERLHLDDLRAYGAVVDGTGRVLQVSPALQWWAPEPFSDSDRVILHGVSLFRCSKNCPR